MSTAALATTTAAAPALAHGRDRILLPSGVQSGDVTTGRAVLWARADRPGRLVARLRSGRREWTVRGPWATPDTDHTAKIALDGLAPGRAYEAELAFEDHRGLRGERQVASFTTAGRRATSFVWTGDTCGQGWGINPDVGGMVAYAAMHATRPDFFLHSGDTIYADGIMQESVVEPDGQVWRNHLTPAMTVAAQTLGEYRERHRYTMLDDHVRAMYAEVPVVAQWDDHETTNNWYPGEILDDPKYDRENRVDVLAAYGRRAWQENMPIADGRGSGRRPGRIYRKLERGPHLDVFCLDMRTHKDPNTAGREPYETHLLGDEQREWLVREVRRSRATWKVIAADLPIGIVVPDGEVNQESMANRDPGAPLGKEIELARILSDFKRHGVRNTVWLTADVHYTAAHHYDPSRAAFTDFDPFWEFVAGPVAAGVAPTVNELDATFGPRPDFAKAADVTGESPRSGNQFFGHVAIDDAGAMTVSLRNLRGETLYTRTLEPAR